MLKVREGCETFDFVVPLALGVAAVAGLWHWPRRVGSFLAWQDGWWSSPVLGCQGWMPPLPRTDQAAQVECFADCQACFSYLHREWRTLQANCGSYLVCWPRWQLPLVVATPDHSVGRKEHHSRNATNKLEITCNHIIIQSHLIMYIRRWNKCVTINIITLHANLFCIF